MWDEFVIGGEVQETSKKNVLKAISDQDMIQEVGYFLLCYSSNILLISGVVFDCHPIGFLISIRNFKFRNPFKCIFEIYLDGNTIQKRCVT